ncbi:MAG: hypothetical protein BroJett026_11880 [Betaproteobacteria bacterium]|nr:MAG: hypothetical protein BroJett026_11880 [Betaproteobacteria bacterium]
MVPLPARATAAPAPDRRRVPPLVAVTLLAAAAGASACGLEDPSSISFRRGALNIAYPQALHVGTAVWQAQAAGVVPPDALLQRDDLAPEARSTLRLLKANALMSQLAARLGDAPASGAGPRLAFVLLGPVLWTRFVPETGALATRFHVPGPDPGDVVVVTDTSVVEAIVAGELTFAGALEGDLARLYGPTEIVATARQWLVGRH